MIKSDQIELQKSLAKRQILQSKCTGSFIQLSTLVLISSCLCVLHFKHHPSQPLETVSMGGGLNVFLFPTTPYLTSQRASSSLLCVYYSVRFVFNQNQQSKHTQPGLLDGFAKRANFREDTCNSLCFYRQK